MLPFWPFARCRSCHRPTMYPCDACGQCAADSQTPAGQARLARRRSKYDEGETTTTEPESTQ